MCKLGTSGYEYGSVVTTWHRTGFLKLRSTPGSVVGKVLQGRGKGGGRGGAGGRDKIEVLKEQKRGCTFYYISCYFIT